MLHILFILIETIAFKNMQKIVLSHEQIGHVGG